MVRFFGLFSKCAWRTHDLSSPLVSKHGTTFNTKPTKPVLPKSRWHSKLIIYYLVCKVRKIMWKSNFHPTMLDFTQNIWLFLPCFSLQNWRVIFEIFRSNFGFAWLNSTIGSLVWDYEWKNWDMFTCSLRSHNFKSVNISGKIRQCDNGKSRNSYGFEAKAKSREIITQLLDSWRAWLIWWPLI